MLVSAPPAALGVDAGRLERAFGLLQGWLDEGTCTAVASVVVRRGRVAGAFYAGATSPAPGAPPVDSESLFHLASIGKPMAAAAVMLLVEAGRLSLDDTLASILPAAAGEGRDAITVRHMLTHTSGLPQDADLAGVPAGAPTAAELAAYPAQRLAVPVGSKVEYSNVGYGLLGLVVEAASGQPFADFVRERLFAPAGMAGAHLPTPEHLHPRVVRVGGTPEPGSAFERFNSAHALAQTHPAGNIVGRALDAAAFFQLFLDGGRAAGRQVLAPATARLMVTNHTAGLRGGIEGFMTWEDCAWGLGFDLRGSKRPHFSGELTSPATFGHTGVAGTFAWADPALDLVCVTLANRMLYNAWNTPRWSRYSTAVAASVLA